jgi:hypothetical protein
MAGNDAFLWFIVTTAVFFALLAIGTLFAVQAYEERKRRAALHFHLPHPMAHRAERRHRH